MKQGSEHFQEREITAVPVLWKLLPLLQSVAFKIPAHLDVVSYFVNAVEKPVLALWLPALTSGC